MPGTPIRTEGMGMGRGERWQRQSVKYRTPHGKYLGETGAAQRVAFQDHQTRQESMRLFLPYFFYPV